MGTLFVDKLDPQSGTSLELGSSGDTVAVNTGATTNLAGNVTLGASGKTITVPSGATITNNGTANGFGGNMTPAFSVVKTDNQSLTNNSDTKITFQTEILDSNGAFASNRFTIPSGTPDAKYFIYGQAFHNSGNNSDLKVATLNIFVNGSRQAMSVSDQRAGQGRGEGRTVTKILGLSAGDYVELYAKVDTDDAGITLDGGDSQTHFGGFKIIT